MSWLPTSRRFHWLVLAAILLAGFAITRHYGESWDERQFYKYADRALQAYSTWPATGDIPLTGNTYDNYGPAFVMLVALGARLLGLVLPWLTSDLRHLIYFPTFLLGVWAFYKLCRRWLSPTASLGASLLMATQPVIWGHAFISPKDVPFLSFLLLTLLLGLNMVDGWADREHASSLGRVPTRLIGLAAASVALIAAVLLAAPWVRAAIDGLVRAAASGQQNVIFLIASDVRTADPAIYTQKYFAWYVRLCLGMILTGAVALGLTARRYPGALRTVKLVLPAGAVLGFTTSIRILGPLAALVVTIYALYRLRRGALSMLALYAIAALFAMYLTWPYLWPDPLGHFTESALVMARYPWRGEVLFDGRLYPSTGLPGSYLPALLAIQLTETGWLAMGAGLVVAAIGAARRERSAVALLLLVLGWCVLPLGGFILSRAPLYDNFRQVLFVLPPLFMLAGLAFERMGSLRLRLAIIALCLLPGIVAGFRLHPYEYIYYNSLVGGERGAFRRFELDYWGTSYREAASYLAVTAPPNSSVWVEGPTHLLQLYARPDLKIYSTYEAPRLPRYDYVVALTRFDLDLTSYPDAPIIHVVERDGAALTVIKKP